MPQKLIPFALVALVSVITLAGSASVAAPPDEVFCKIEFQRAQIGGKVSAYVAFLGVCRDSKYADEARRYIAAHIPKPRPTPTRPIPPIVPPTQIETPLKPVLSGRASAVGDDKVRLAIDGHVIRLAQVRVCNPGSGRTLADIIDHRSLICRPLGANYRCITEDTNEDVAALAVDAGVARPQTGDAYLNEYYRYRNNQRDSSRLCLPE